MKIAHDLLRVLLWFLLSGLASAALMAVWRSQYSSPSDESAAAFVACMVAGLVLAVGSFFVSKRVAGALIPLTTKTRSHA
ncbi:MAG: hypothetical protein K2X12_02730 [Burkholderiaceae bacterium]|nr:hypothetical protein [Burkholderiaceae bacterium]